MYADLPTSTMPPWCPPSSRGSAWVIARRLLSATFTLTGASTKRLAGMVSHRQSRSLIYRTCTWNVILIQVASTMAAGPTFFSPPSSLAPSTRAASPGLCSLLFITGIPCLLLPAPLLPLLLPTPPLTAPRSFPLPAWPGLAPPTTAAWLQVRAAPSSSSC